MEPDELIAAFEAEAEALAAAAERGLDATVATCPGWDVAELVAHTGSVHRWATLAIRTTDLVAPPPRRPPGVARGPALVDWLREGAAALGGEMRAAPRGAAVWSWAGPRTPEWWIRRQALETAVHRVDAQLAQGGGDGVRPDLAAAGFEELFDTWTSRYPGIGEGAEERTLHVHATDGGVEWLVRLLPGGLTATPEHAKGDVALRGTASDLYLWMWNRLPLERLEVFGDASVARLWTRTARF